MPDNEIRANILIVDDTPANLRLLANMLSGQSYKVRPVPNGPLALKAADLDPPDLILLDINMPDMNGYDVCEHLKANERTKGIPIIFISALDEVGDKVKAFQVGGVDYVSKPFQVEEVLARVGNHLNLIALQKQLLTAKEELEQRVEERTQEVLRQMDLFQKFVPQTLTKTMNQEGFDVSNGISQEETYSVLSCDIRDFTTFSESISCTECFKFLNSFFSVMGPGIREFGGFEYQYLGDAIMALFKLDEGQTTDNVVHSAIAIQHKIMVDYNKGRERAGYPPIRIGVGINTGPVAIGVAGTPDRLDACAFGSTVNLAARCESLTKDLGAKIIITEYTRKQLANPGAFHLRDLGEQEIRGMEQKVRLFEVLDAEDARENT